MLELWVPSNIPQKHVLKCSVSRVLDWIQQWLFLVIGDQWRYSGYLDLSWGKINKWLKHDWGDSKGHSSIKLLHELLPLFQGVWNRSHLVMTLEDYRQCVAREVREETGIIIDVTKLEYLSTYELPINGWEELLVVVNYGYRLWDFELKEIQLSSEHVASYRLTKGQMEELAGCIVPSLRYVLGLSTEFVDEKPRVLEKITPYNS